jgi:hypothetical protein
MDIQVLVSLCGYSYLLLHSRDICGPIEMPLHSLNECKVGFYLAATLKATISNLVGDFGFKL